MKHKLRFVLAFLLIILLIGGTACEGKNLDNAEMVEKLIDDVVDTTHKAVENHDVKLARELWSKISEYGVRAREMGQKELADSLGKLASTYVYLVQYLQTGDQKQLELFEKNFDQAITGLRQCLKKRGAKT